MAQALGYVTEQENGIYNGNLFLRGIKNSIQILPNKDKENDRQPDYRVITADRRDIGGGWNKVGKVSGKAYLSLCIASPEFGDRKIYANLGQARGRPEGEMAILWNPIN